MLKVECEDLKSGDIRIQLFKWLDGDHWHGTMIHVGHYGAMGGMVCFRPATEEEVNRAIISFGLRFGLPITREQPVGRI